MVTTSIASLADEPIRQDLPDPLYTWHFINHVTGKQQVITFHHLSYKQMEIRLNGKKWAVGGFTTAFRLISENCPKISN